MTHRRDFLVALGGMLGASLAGTRAGGARQVTVTAQATIFHGHPDGRTTLVRFIATGVEAPAGRLRVFDRRRRLVGTAGMLRRGTGLVGELWLQLDGSTRLTSELETPVTQRPVRTAHVVSPSPRWTLQWINVADADQLTALLDAVHPLTRGAVAAAYVEMGVRGNPIWLPPPHMVTDHLDVARIAVPAARLADRIGIPMATIGVSPDAGAAVRLAEALAGSGVAAHLDALETTDPAALGIGDGLSAMQRHLADRLAALETPPREGPVLLVSRDPTWAPRVYAAVRDWNSRFAYPRIDIGDGPSSPAAATGAGVGPVGGPRGPGYEPATLDGVAGARAAHAVLRSDMLFSPLAGLVAPGDPTLEGIARQFTFPVPGMLVFNPSPFTRSDLVTLPDGRPAVVTDVPAVGYAFIPDLAENATPVPEEREGVLSAGSPRFEVVIDGTTGAITSLTDKSTGRELAGGVGLNLVAGSRLAGTALSGRAGVGQQLVVRRQVARGTLTTTITLYDALPWVDVENAASVPAGAGIEYGFSGAGRTETVQWEVPGGSRTGTPPIEHLHHLRWIALRRGTAATMIGTPDTAYGSVDAEGRITAAAGAGRTRFRIASGDPALADDPWRVGWSVEPLRAVPTAGTGAVALPSFGRILEIRDPGAAIVGLKAADDGVGAILYVQELMGVSRPARVLSGTLTFTGAVRTDLVERDLELLDVTDGSTTIHLSPFGFTAVRLLGIRLAA